MGSTASKKAEQMQTSYLEMQTCQLWLSETRVCKMERNSWWRFPHPDEKLCHLLQVHMEVMLLENSVCLTNVCAPCKLVWGNMSQMIVNKLIPPWVSGWTCEHCGGWCSGLHCAGWPSTQAHGMTLVIPEHPPPPVPFQYQQYPPITVMSKVQIRASLVAQW